MSSKRRSKVECINISDDDSAGEQPPVKNKKREQIPSPEIIELKKKVMELELKNAKLEKNFQDACRIAGEAQARVKFLENLIDVKPKVVEGAVNTERENELEKIIEELTSKLAQYEGQPQQPLVQQLQQTPAAVSTVQQPRRKSFMGTPNATGEKERVAAEESTPPLTAVSPLDSATAVNKTIVSVPALLPHINLTGSEENVVDDEQTRWAYGESQKMAAASSMTTSDIEKTESASERLRINDQLKELSPLLIREEATIRAKFNDISNLTKKRVYSQTTEFSGTGWKMGVRKDNHNGSPHIEFCLIGEKDKIEWSCSVIVELQLVCQNTGKVTTIRRTSKRNFKSTSSTQVLTSVPVEKLYEMGMVINDSIVLAVAITSLPNVPAAGDPQPACQTLQQLLQPLFPGLMIPQPQQHPAASMPPLMHQNIPTAASAPLVQQPQLHPAATIGEVTIHAKFNEISKLKAKEYVYSQTTEYHGLTWKISVFKRKRGDDFHFCLKGQQDNAIAWSCPVTLEIQFSSQKSEEIISLKTVEKCFNEKNRYQMLASFSPEQLNENGYVIDDSIMVAVVIKVIPSD